MPIITTDAQNALVDAVRSITGGKRLRSARGAQVLTDACDGEALAALAAAVRDRRPMHSGPGPSSRLGDLRETLEEAVSAALGPIAMRSETELRITSLGEDPARTTGRRGAAPGRVAAGWRTAVRFTLLVEVPHGTTWTVHAPGGDLRLDTAGSLGVLGPDVASSWQHSPTTAPVVTCTTRTLVRAPRRLLGRVVPLHPRSA